MDRLVRGFPKYLAAEFGYEIKNQETRVTQKGMFQSDTVYKWLDGPNPINLPFAMGETSKMFLGSGLDECLAHIVRLLNALQQKWKTTNEIDMYSAIGYFVGQRAELWSAILIDGKVGRDLEMAENSFACYFMPEDQERITLIKKLVASSPVPNIWGQAIKNQIDTLLSMRQQRQILKDSY